MEPKETEGVRRCVLSPTPFMLLNECSRLFGQRMRKYADDQGVPYGYRELLMHLAILKAHGKSGISQYELARMTRLSPPTVSSTLQKMERDGYITREPDESDARQMRVRLTGKGESIENSNHEKAHEIELAAYSGLTDTEKCELTQILKKIRDNLACGNDMSPTERSERQDNN